MARKTASRWTVGHISSLVKGSVLFCFVELQPTFTANPPDLLYVLEGNNITFVWQYNFSGSFEGVEFQFVVSSTAVTILDKHDLNSDAVVLDSVFQGRIQENINATRAEITIFALRRSDSGKFEIKLINVKRQRATKGVDVQVQCK